MSDRADHRKGLLITLAGVLAICPDTLIVRIIDTDPWTMTFWRGLLIGLGLMVFYAAAEGRGWLGKVAAIGRPGLLAALLFSINAICFILALAHTTVANTLMVVATAPLFGAMLSRLFLGERVERRTWIAILAALLGIAVIFSGSLEAGGLLGDLLALGTALGLAGGFTVVRRSRAVNMVPAMALGGFITASVSVWLAAPFSLSPPAFGLMLFLGLLLLPVAFGLITLGPRYITAPEVSLLMLLETALGPLIVWIALGEAPSELALLGGVIVFATLTLHAMLGFRRGAPG